MKPERILEQCHNSPNNVRFTDLEKLAEAFGFVLARTKGSHHIFRHPKVVAHLNLQPLDGKAKPYQVKQLLALVEEYDLTLSDV